jgi:hypothetical protein
MVNDVLPFALIRKQCASGMYRRKRAGGTPHALRVCAGLCECECVNVRICTYMREMFNIFLFVPGPYVVCVFVGLARSLARARALSVSVRVPIYA